MAAASVKETGDVAYYVSSQGDDSNSGTEKAPFKTIEKVNQVLENKASTTKAVVYFRRGDTFRGKLVAQSNTTFTAYGSGDKPVVTVSPEAASSASSWSLVSGTKNIWQYKDELPDVGVISFNEGESYSVKDTPSYSTDTGFIEGGSEDSPVAYDFKARLIENLHHVSLADSVVSGGYPVREEAVGELYLCCEGNPAEVYNSIEIGVSSYIIDVTDTANVTVDNLCIKYGGAHGIGGGDVTDLTVKNCEVGRIGGGIQKYEDNGVPVRYGNGIEVHGSCDGYTVENCYIYQCYDAGITHQRGADAVTRNVSFKNVTYRGNLVEDCAYSIEYFMTACTESGYERTMENILIDDNILRRAGEGFGNQRLGSDEYGYRYSHIMGWWWKANVAENFVISNNIFDRSEYALIMVAAENEEYLPTFSGNTYIQNAYTSSDNVPYIGVYDKKVEKNGDYNITAFNSGAEQYIKNNIDATAKVYSSIAGEDSMSKAKFFAKYPVSGVYRYEIPVRDTVVIRSFKQLSNELRVTDITIPSIAENPQGSSVNLLHISDIHFNTINDLDRAKLPSAVAMYDGRSLNKNTKVHINNLHLALGLGKYYSKSIITGDIMDYFSYGNMAAVKENITDKYKNVLLTMGNHDSIEILSSINGSSTEVFNNDYRYSYINRNVYTTNDIYLHGEIIRDGNGYDKVMVVTMDNQNYQYHLNSAQIEQFKNYITVARAKQIPLLIFQHEPLSTGWADISGKDIITVFDNRDNPNGKGEDWGKNSKLIGGSLNSHAASKEIYDIITNNGDVIRGVFTGHTHNNVYTELVAKTPEGKTVYIPQYTVCGNYSKPYVNSITVK